VPAFARAHTPHTTHPRYTTTTLPAPQVFWSIRQPRTACWPDTHGRRHCFFSTSMRQRIRRLYDAFFCALHRTLHFLHTRWLDDLWQPPPPPCHPSYTHTHTHTHTLHTVPQHLSVVTTLDGLQTPPSDHLFIHFYLSPTSWAWRACGIYGTPHTHTHTCLSAFVADIRRTLILLSMLHHVYTHKRAFVRLVTHHCTLIGCSDERCFIVLNVT